MGRFERKSKEFKPYEKRKKSVKRYNKNGIPIEGERHAKTKRFPGEV